MHRPLRDLVCAVLGAALALALTGRAAASDAVPADRVVAALVAAPYDWRPDAARAIAAESPAVAVDDLYPFGGRFVPVGYGGPRVEVGTTRPLALTVDHEYRHAWEFQRVGYSDAAMLAAFDRLAAQGEYPESARRARLILAKRSTDLWHANHWLLGDAPIDPLDSSSTGLHWRYELVPPGHRATWMAYGRVRRAILPLVAR